MRISILCAAVAASLAISSGAHANDFSGFRIEARTGYDNNSSSGISAGGILGGVGAGYDTEISNNVVVGIEANIDFSSAKYLVVFEPYASQIHAQRDIELSARLGYKASPKAMFYVKGGYANGGFGLETQGPDVELSESDTAGGYRIGIGFERLIGKRGYAKAEYRYTHYDSAQINRNQVIFAAGWRF